MSRSDQWMDIPPEARKFIEKHELIAVDSERKVSMAFGAPDEVLYDYYYPGTEPDAEGQTRYEPLLSEVEQCTPWSSGPCYFIKLVDKYNRDVFSWEPEDIENC